MNLSRSFFILLLFLNVGCASIQQAEANSPYKSCKDDSDKQALRSKELQTIVKADQDDRIPAPESIDWAKVLIRDEDRRKVSAP